MYKKLLSPVIFVGREVKRIKFFGFNLYCPVCHRHSSRFLPHGRTPRNNARCPRCNSMERHRFIWFYLQGHTDLFDGRKKKMLHVAPEKCFSERIRKRVGEGYLTADLYDPNAMVKMDITNIEYPDNHFDVIYCSHVLEHVPNDRKAMREFHRVLKEDGWAIFMVPIKGDKTYEDPSIETPEDRLKYYGQEDHVRIYGADFVDRLRESGFDVKVARCGDIMTDEQIRKMAMQPHVQVFYCTRQAV